LVEGSEAADLVEGPAAPEDLVEGSDSEVVDGLKDLDSGGLDIEGTVLSMHRGTYLEVLP
jgi:hypothetical protein